MHYVTSCIEGRVRVRHQALCHAEVAAQARDMLSDMPGVIGVTLNNRTGSLLLEYDPAVFDIDSMLSLASEWLGAQEMAAPADAASPPPLFSGRAMTQALNTGMLATLGACFAFALMGRMRAHTVAGGLFMILNAVHVAKYRRNL